MKTQGLAVLLLSAFAVAAPALNGKCSSCLAVAAPRTDLLDNRTRRRQVRGALSPKIGLGRAMVFFLRCSQVIEARFCDLIKARF